MTNRDKHPLNHPFGATLLRWYAANGRTLPWRGSRDPYAIWISEIILQQTRIAQGEAYWHRFIQRFPTVESLAEASEQEVLRLWQGLGYYSRARNLHCAAKQIVALRHFPNTLQELRALKGVGDYTAAAIGSMAFGLDIAAVDGNVYRVLARYFDISTPINGTTGKRMFQELATSLITTGQAAEFNQAMMDFGALVCRPGKPQCEDCPLANSCAALAEGVVNERPVKNKKPAQRARHFNYVFLVRDHKVLMRRRGAGDIWQGLWEPILCEGDDFDLRKTLDEWGLNDAQCGITQLAPRVKHVLTHQVIHADAFRVDTDKAPESLSTGYRSVTLEEIDSLPKPRLVEIFLQRLFTLPD